MRRLFPYLVLILGVLWVGDVSAAYKGQIVDAETKEPLEGVVVVIDWDQAHIMSGHTYVDAYETVTDKDGRFSLPSWWSLNPWKLFTTSHTLLIFKSGYEPIGTGRNAWPWLTSEANGVPDSPYVWKIEKGQPVILLKPVSDYEQRKKNLGFVSPSVPEDKQRLLQIEKDKERKVLGYD